MPLLGILLGLFTCTEANSETLIPPGLEATWRYFDQGRPPAEGWSKADFDDGAWRAGSAPLGYGEDGLSTEVSFGADATKKPITTYFRREFVILDPKAIDRLVLLMRVDDGAIVLLNGRELLRENLAADANGFEARATRRIEGAEERVYRRYSVLPAALVTGRNVLAVEVHQFNSASSDLFFDLHLEAYGNAAREASFAFWKQHLLPGTLKIPDGYVDGGRTSQLDELGNVRSEREVIAIDRHRDRALDEHLAFARSSSITRFPSLARARMLALYVDLVSSPSTGREDALDAAEHMLAEYRGTELLLGKSLEAGVCRHRALLFKLLADEAGLEVSLVRGNLDQAAGAHAWNELNLAGGQKHIVDCMNPAPGFDLPKTTAPVARHYRTVNNEPYYPATTSKKSR